jgi:hypothetical protein
MPWILVGSFGRNYVVLWVTEKDKFVAMYRDKILPEICVFCITQNTTYFLRNFYRAFRMSIGMCIFNFNFLESHGYAFWKPGALVLMCQMHFSMFVMILSLARKAFHHFVGYSYGNSLDPYVTLSLAEREPPTMNFRCNHLATVALDFYSRSG